MNRLAFTLVSLWTSFCYYMVTAYEGTSAGEQTFGWAKNVWADRYKTANRLTRGAMSWEFFSNKKPLFFFIKL